MTPSVSTGLNISIRWRTTAILLVPGVAVGLGLAEASYRVLAPAPLLETGGPTALMALSVFTLLFAGFVEELLFRGILQRTLEHTIGRWRGLLVSSLLFGLTYSVYGNVTAVALGGGIGLLLGWTYDRSNSLGLVTVVHATLNVALFIGIPL